MSDLYFPVSLPCLKLRSRRIVWGTDVQEAPSGAELRSSYWTAPRYAYSYEVDVRDSLSERAEVEGFLNAHQGRGESFLLADPVDGIARRCRFDDDEMEAQRIAGGVYSGTVEIATVTSDEESGVVLVDDDLSILTDDGTVLI